MLMQRFQPKETNLQLRVSFCSELCKKNYISDNIISFESEREHGLPCTILTGTVYCRSLVQDYKTVIPNIVK